MLQEGREPKLFCSMKQIAKILTAPNKACTGRGCRPRSRSAVCQIWRDNIQESCQSAPPVTQTVSRRLAQRRQVDRVK